MITILFAMILLAGNAIAQPLQKSNRGMAPDKAQVVEYWTKERMEKAIPRDLVIDPRGLGYMRMPNGFLEPYGHEVAAEANADDRQPLAKPPTEDLGTTSINDMNPSESTIGSSHTFSATVVDPDGIKSVSFTIQYPDGFTTQSFNPSKSGDTWSASLQGFSDGNWSWWVVAKDGAAKGGNTTISNVANFTVDTNGGGGGGGDTGTDTITNSAWTNDGIVQTAAGRIYFEMPNNSKRKGPWTGYVCSGTVVYDGDNTEADDRSVILTAAHCVYDDANKAFARNVLFIPNQADTIGSGTDLNCENDPLGCWVPSHGVVDIDWTTRTFPNNIPWDYAFYVVDNVGAHSQGFGPYSDILDMAAGDMEISFSSPHFDDDDGLKGKDSNDYTHALGYSYSEDPQFMYCAEDMTTEGADNWWLPSCGLSGGSSGGSWVQKMDSTKGDGPVISVNSWGYTNSPGMAGPKLSGTSAECVYTEATTEWTVSTADGEAGIVKTCP
jgi:hypothetical protein